MARRQSFRAVSHGPLRGGRDPETGKGIAVTVIRDERGNELELTADADLVAAMAAAITTEASLAMLAARILCMPGGAGEEPGEGG